jgi:hypothetical protein
VARALSLLLQNCGGSRLGEVQRGQWGNPLRLSGCVGELAVDGWEPLNVRRGYRPGQTVLTALSAYPGTPSPITIAPLEADPVAMLDLVCHAAANWGGSQWTRGTYILMVGPHHARTFIDHGRTQDRISGYVIDNTAATVADLKHRGTWGRFSADVSDRDDISAADHQRLVRLSASIRRRIRHLFAAPARSGRVSEIITIVAGGNTGSRFELVVPYQISSNPVSKPVRFPAQSSSPSAAPGGP